MIVEIKSKNEVIKNDEVDHVIIQYSARNEGRTVHAGGRYELSVDEYEDMGIDDLKDKAKEHLIDEINAE